MEILDEKKRAVLSMQLFGVHGWSPCNQDRCYASLSFCEGARNVAFSRRIIFL